MLIAATAKYDAPQTRRFDNPDGILTELLVMDRDRRLTGSLRGQTDKAVAPPGFELNNPWKVRVVGSLQRNHGSLTRNNSWNRAFCEKPDASAQLHQRKCRIRMLQVYILERRSIGTREEERRTKQKDFLILAALFPVM